MDVRISKGIKSVDQEDQRYPNRLWPLRKFFLYSTGINSAGHFSSSLAIVLTWNRREPFIEVVHLVVSVVLTGPGFRAVA